MNELGVLAKFIFKTLTTDSYWTTNFQPKGSMFFQEDIPQGINVQVPHAMFVTVDSEDILGNFGFRLMTKGIYQIKAVVEGSQYSLLYDMANQIDRLFDWQNQIDPAAGRPVSQQVFTDPDDPTVSIMIMCMVRQRPIMYPTFNQGVNYCHLGGEYLIEYYKN